MGGSTVSKTYLVTRYVTKTWQKEFVLDDMSSPDALLENISGRELNPVGSKSEMFYEEVINE